jgi:hypothetical protein
MASSFWFAGAFEGFSAAGVREPQGNSGHAVPVPLGSRKAQAEHELLPAGLKARGVVLE